MDSTVHDALKAPHLYASQSQRIMVAWVCAALAPSALWGFMAFGWKAVLVVAVSIAAALLCEGAIDLALRRFTLSDGTAFLTGFIIGLSMPAGVSIAVPALASCFAVVVVKWSFGGLGSNWMNPAMAGTAFAYLGWPKSFSSWMLPRSLSGVEGLTGSTPIMIMRDQAFSGSFRPDAYAVTGFDTAVTNWLNESVFRPLGASLPGGYVDLFVGNHPGAIGELSVLLLLAGTIALISKRVIRWEIPASVILAFSSLTWIFGALPSSGLLFSGDALFGLCTGAVVFVAFFCSTDPVSSPMSFVSRVIYGLGIGSLIFLFRFLGGRGDGAAFAVIFMNCLVPAIDYIRFSGKRLGKALL
jgi:Na+-translocating ferredoxin:NAD+ oxidoreductase subunit D